MLSMQATRMSPQSSLADEPVDPLILKKLSASVSHSFGGRKNLSYIVSVEAFPSDAIISRAERESSQLITRSLREFREFHKSLLARVNSVSSSTSLPKCTCEGNGHCAFDGMQTQLIGVHLSRMPIWKVKLSQVDIQKRKVEMNQFLAVVFSILRRVNQDSCHSNCLFLQDIMTFLLVEQTFSNEIKDLLKLKSRRMNLNGWKSHTAINFGAGIHV